MACLRTGFEQPIFNLQYPRSITDQRMSLVDLDYYGISIGEIFHMHGCLVDGSIGIVEFQLRLSTDTYLNGSARVA